MNFVDDDYSFSDFVIAILQSQRSTSILRKELLRRMNKRKSVSRTGYDQGIHRLKKRGFIQVAENRIVLTKIGQDRFCSRLSRTKLPGKAKMICIFDIPESKRSLREWFRTQLKLWDYKMVQKSVWIGPGPFPFEFKRKLELLGISKGVKTFKISKTSN
jgi:DNA-binding transcriptional regulator PaaX